MFVQKMTKNNVFQKNISEGTYVSCKFVLKLAYDKQFIRQAKSTSIKYLFNEYAKVMKKIISHMTILKIQK